MVCAICLAMFSMYLQRQLQTCFTKKVCPSLGKLSFNFNGGLPKLV